jgi:hypothetical protein
MTQTPLETSSGALYALLVTLTWSNAPTTGTTTTVKRYTNWTSPITDTDTFESAPDMEVDLGENHGGTQDKPGRLTVSKEHSPFDVLRSGLVHPRVEILVEQVDPSNASNTRRTIFSGHLGKVQANPGGRAGLVRVQLNGAKAELANIRLGVPATRTCQWIFGDSTTCGYDKEATKLSGEVLSIGSPERTSVTLDVGSGTSPNTHFKRGTIKVGGMSLTIRQSYDNGTFDLFRVPPDWIVGLDVEVFEGCDKQYSTCQQFGRQSRFMGLGIRIPDRQPLLEIGDS